MRRTLLAAAIVAVLAAAVAPAAWASEATVEIGDGVTPSAVTVPAGGTVTWHNADGERHRVRSTTGPEKFDSGNLEPSETWSHTFTAPGVYRYEDARGDDQAYQGSVTVTGQGGAAAGAAGQDGQGGGSGPISMRDRAFTPPSVSVAAGTTVTWTNDSDRDHTVTADDGSFDSGTLPPGASFTHTFDEAGSFGYFCALHSGMRGTVTVGDGAGTGEAPAGDDATVAGAGGTDGSGGGAQAPQGSAAPAGAAEPGHHGSDAEVEVEVRDFAFEPEALEVRPGTTVTWRQVGEAPHTVTADDGSFDSGTLATGEVASHTFTEPGTYRYTCELHPQMVAAVTVTDAATGEAGAGGAPGVDAAPEADAAQPAAPRSSPGGGAQGGGAPAPTATASAAPGSVPLAAASRQPAVSVPLAGLLVLGVLLPASVLVGAWRIERALRSPAPSARPSRPAR